MSQQVDVIFGEQSYLQTANFLALCAHRCTGPLCLCRRVFSPVKTIPKACVQLSLSIHRFSTKDVLFSALSVNKTASRLGVWITCNKSFTQWFARSTYTSRTQKEAERLSSESFKCGSFATDPAPQRNATAPRVRTASRHDAAKTTQRAAEMKTRLICVLDGTIYHIMTDQT